MRPRILTRQSFFNFPCKIVCLEVELHRKALKTAVLPAVGMHPVVLMIVLSQGK